MARGKHSVALFEVIHKDKRFEQKIKTAPLLQTPSWWFKRNSAGKANSSPADAPVQTPSPARIAAAPAAGASTAHSLPHRITSAPDPKPLAKPRPQRRPLAESFTVRLRASWSNLQPKLASRLGRFNTAFAGFTGIAAALLVCAAILLVRHHGNSSPAKIGNLVSTAQLRAGAAHPEVLEVAGNTSTQTQHHLDTHPATFHPEDPASQAQPAGSAQPPAAARQINLNYVLIQSYADEKIANEACDFLNKNGVACTIERNVKGWRKDFYLVIGLQSFVRASGPDYAAYRNRIEDLSTKFSPKSTNYKAFMPLAIKWDRPN